MPYLESFEFGCAVPPLGGTGMTELPNRGLIGRSVRHYVCTLISEDDAVKKHY